MPNFDDILIQALHRRREAGHLRTLKPLERLGGGRVRLGDRVLLDCSSNDYLGLTHHPHLIAKASAYVARYGTGSGAARLVTGHSEACARVEARLAQAKGVERALIMVSGWQCNASVIPPLVDPALWEGRKAVVLVDKLIHASLYAGCGLGEAQVVRFRHNDLAHLADLLEQYRDQPKWVITESVFSMDGDRADLAALVALCQHHEALLYVDEAHATGVLGAGGMGLAVGLDIPVVMGTFSKALGGFGAYVAGSQALIEYLINRASGFVYATALPPAILGAMDGVLDLLPGLDSERQKLQQRAAWVRAELNRAGLNTGLSTTQIIPVILGDETTTLQAAERLKDMGILAIAIRPPTVPPGTSRLRVSLSATHTDSDMEFLTQSLIAVCTS